MTEMKKMAEMTKLTKKKGQKRIKMTYLCRDCIALESIYQMDQNFCSFSFRFVQKRKAIVTIAYGVSSRIRLLWGGYGHWWHDQVCKVLLPTYVECNLAKTMLSIVHKCEWISRIIRLRIANFLPLVSMVLSTNLKEKWKKFKYQMTKMTKNWGLE